VDEGSVKLLKKSGGQTPLDEDSVKLLKKSGSEKHVTTKKKVLTCSHRLHEIFNIAIFVRSNSACSEHLFVAVVVAYYAACLLRLW
jgi:hypothetical protein